MTYDINILLIFQVNRKKRIQSEFFTSLTRLAIDSHLTRIHAKGTLAWMATTPPIQLKEGDPAPDFTALDQNGDSVTLSELKGKAVLLYFYPKDNTPGCTKEACAFRDQFSQFEKKDVEVIGVSPDSVKSHDKFVNKYELPFTLVADTEKEIVKAYGVWGEKKFMGRTFDGTFRASFLIARNGTIQKIWPKVKPEAHPAEVLESL